jgi:glycyl-tRNA synthetase
MANAETTTMDELVALCKRRGFVYPASEIYGGINGFWDYGPLGIQLKNNIRDHWWKRMVECPPIGPDGEVLQIVGLDSSIIQNPKTWEASGHVGGFNDPMVDDTETKQRFRADHFFGVFLVEHKSRPTGSELAAAVVSYDDRAAELIEAEIMPAVTIVASNRHEAFETFVSNMKRLRKEARLPSINVDGGIEYTNAEDREGRYFEVLFAPIPLDKQEVYHAQIPSPFTQKTETLTPPRQFNLMFETFVGAIRNDDAKAYLRPETAQGIFLNYKNVLDTMRVKVPFGVAQIGKAFRNEVTPRNFIFRSREFEQMEMEWFCHPDDSAKWYEFWKDERMKWWVSLGIKPEHLRFRDHDEDELAHYSKMCVDVEYKYPFTAPGFGELEGIAHRGCFDLTQHQEHSKTKMDYFDQELQVELQKQGVDKEEIRERSRYIPNVIEPASGLTRGALVLLCEAFTPTPERSGSKYIMKFHPKFAPVKAAVLPLVAKDGMPEIAEKLYMDLRDDYVIDYDVKQSVGKRYARQDEIGTPFCFTIDGETKENNTVTVRHRDSGDQERIDISKVRQFLAEKITADVD